MTCCVDPVLFELMRFFFLLTKVQLISEKCQGNRIKRKKETKEKRQKKKIIRSTRRSKKSKGNDSANVQKAKRKEETKKSTLWTSFLFAHVERNQKNERKRKERKKQLTLWTLAVLSGDFSIEIGRAFFFANVEPLNVSSICVSF